MKKPCSEMFCLRNQDITDAKAFFFIFYVELRLIKLKNRKSNTLDLRRFSMKTSKYSDSLIMSILK